MIYNFKVVEGDAQYVIDIEALTWAHTSSLLTAPSLVAAKDNWAAFMPVEEGKLSPLGGGRFHFVGRKSPQLALIAVLWIPVSEPDGVTMVNILQANVDIKDGKAQEITKYKTECMPAARQAPNPALQPIQQPPITIDEIAQSAKGE